MLSLEAAGDHKLAQVMGVLLLTSKARCIFVRDLGISWEMPQAQAANGVVSQ